VTRRLQRRPDDPHAVRERTAEPSAPPPASLLELQRSAGNAAVARVLAREPAADAPLQFTKPPPLSLGLNPFLYAPKLAPDVERAVDAYIADQRGSFRLQIDTGTTSMPEVIDRIRRTVPAAADGSAEAIRARVIEVFGFVPEHRTKPSMGGQKAEAESRIANLFASVPTSVTVGGSQTSLTVGIKGAELKTGKVTTTGDHEGGEVELKKGEVKVGASGKWDGSEFGLKTEVGGVKFESKVHRQGDGWGWSGGLTIPLSGEEVDELPDVSGAVSGAHAALAESLGYLQGGGSLTDGYVTGRMAKIKPAIDAAKNIAGRTKPGATLRITGSADGGGWTAGVALVITF
jgi:hypothetical protein